MLIAIKRLLLFVKAGRRKTLSKISELKFEEQSEYIFTQCFRITNSQNFPVDCCFKIMEHLFMFFSAMTYCQINIHLIQNSYKTQWSTLAKVKELQ